jgi:hypothetical protein
MASRSAKAQEVLKKVVYSAKSCYNVLQNISEVVIVTSTKKTVPLLSGRFFILSRRRIPGSGILVGVIPTTTFAHIAGVKHIFFTLSFEGILLIKSCKALQ